MKISFSVFCAALFAALLRVSAASAQGLDVQETDLDQWIAKNNAYVKLLNDSLRARDSLNRYGSWVNVQTGPTGKERIIYGLYSIGASGARDAIAGARKAASSPPAAPDLDAAAKDLADKFEALFPVLNEASDYYDRKDYMDDNMAGGNGLMTQVPEEFPSQRS